MLQSVLLVLSQTVQEGWVERRGKTSRSLSFMHYVFGKFDRGRVHGGHSSQPVLTTFEKHALNPVARRMFQGVQTVELCQESKSSGDWDALAAAHHPCMPPMGVDSPCQPGAALLWNPPCH